MTSLLHKSTSAMTDKQRTMFSNKIHPAKRFIENENFVNIEFNQNDQIRNHVHHLRE